MQRYSLKQAFKGELSQPARDKDGDIIREKVNGVTRIVTRGDIVIDKCISRAEKGDMYACKLIVDLVEPKELRVAVASAVTIDHTLNPVLQKIIDRLSLIEKEKPILPDTDSGDNSKK